MGGNPSTVPTSLDFSMASPSYHAMSHIVNIMWPQSVATAINLLPCSDDHIVLVATNIAVNHK